MVTLSLVMATAVIVVTTTHIVVITIKVATTTILLCCQLYELNDLSGQLNNFLRDNLLNTVKTTLGYLSHANPNQCNLS